MLQLGLRNVASVGAEEVVLPVGPADPRPWGSTGSRPDPGRRIGACEMAWPRAVAGTRLCRSHGPTRDSESTMLDWQELFAHRWAVTALVACACVAAWLLARLVAELFRSLETRQRVRHAATVLAVGAGLLGFVVTWLPEIQRAFLGFTALAVAFVLAWREWFACLVGSLHRIVSSLYRIGDRIEVDGLRGDVVDIGLLSTTLLEVGPSERSQQSTGRLVRLPHSLLLTHAVHHATETGFRWHEISVSPPAGLPIDQVEAALAELGEAEHAPIQASLDAAVQRLRRRVAYRPPPGRPHVFAHLDREGHPWLTLRYAVPVRQQRVSEDRVTRALFARFGSEAFARVDRAGRAESPSGAAPGPGDEPGRVHQSVAAS